MTSPSLFRALLGLLMLGKSSLALSQQDVQGVKLGITKVSELRAMRNDLADSGKSVDGWRFLVFRETLPRYTFYYSDDDLIIEWARVFVIPGYTATRVREAFGRPDTTVFSEDLSKQESFKSGKVLVSYNPKGEVSHIEYHSGFQYSIGYRRFERAIKIRDSVMADVLREQHPQLTMEEALDSVWIMRAAKAQPDSRNRPSARRRLSTATISQAAARFDSLCVQIECPLIMKTHRAFDLDP